MVSLQDLLAEEFKPFLATNRDNISVAGPQVMLEPQAALALGTAIHELTTNAVKYGALWVEEGNVSVRWRVEQGAEGKQIALEWIEKNGPPVVAPIHRAFGMTLIERGLKQDMSAEAENKFAAEGVRATLRAPLGNSTDLAVINPAVS